MITPIIAVLSVGLGAEEEEVVKVSTIQVTSLY